MDKDPTKLTSFRPLNPVSSSSSFSFSRFIAFGRRKTSQPPRLPVTPELLRKDSYVDGESKSIECSSERNVDLEPVHEKVYLQTHKYIFKRIVQLLLYFIYFKLCFKFYKH